MPDNTGVLTEKDKAKVIAWLGSRGVPIPACPFCGSREWAIGDHLVQPVTLGPQNALQLGGIGYPQVMLVSQKCGYTAFINAVVVGLLPRHDAPAEK